MNTADPNSRRTFMPVALALVVVAAYLPGLAGPFVLDDHVNLQPVWSWLAGNNDVWSAATQNRSGPTGRPLAYLTFIANAAIAGTSPAGFKLVNLALHLCAAGLALAVARRVACHDRSVWPAALVYVAVAAWALHPMQVSSVLYVVQRMALLGAIAQLAAIALYLQARPLLERDPRRGRLLLFVAIPAVVVAGLLAKETAILAVLLCAAAEVTLFRDAPKRQDVRAFFLLWLWLPATLGLAVALIDPARLTGEFAGREFTMAQRLLSGPRILADYAWRWVWPADFGLYRDGYRASIGLLTPPATLLAGLGCAAAAILAIAIGKRQPVFAFGVLWFLLAHSLEAGPLSLELYFEHRNYLPSLGLALAVAALVAPSTLRHGRTWAGLAVALLAGLAVPTFARTSAWRDIDSLLISEAPPPGEISRRLQVDRAIRAFESGDADARENALAVLDGGSAGDRASAALWRAIFVCQAGEPVAPALHAALLQRLPATVTHNHQSAIELLAVRVGSGRCRGLDRARFAAVLDAWLSNAAMPPHTRRRLLGLRDQTIDRASP